MIDATSTASDIAAAVRAGTVSAADIVEQTVTRIERLNGTLNAFTYLDVDRAKAAAARIDRLVKEGTDPGPLAGATFAVKNLFDIDGVVTLAGSKINRDHAPARADSPLIERLTAAGAILIGALNMGEYA